MYKNCILKRDVIMNKNVVIKSLLSIFFFTSIQSFEYCFGQMPAKFYSQCGQDSFVYNTFFKNKTDGVFVDIGAHNGIDYSNTCFFEKHLGWKGICIEPIPNIFNQLRKNRDCICIEGCIYDKAGTIDFLQVASNNGEFLSMLSGIVEKIDVRQLNRIVSSTSNGSGTFEEIEVNCYKINDILALHDIYHVDYLSLDTEGSELEILKSIDFERYTIDVIDVENNFHESMFEEFLIAKGYKKLTELAWDDIYVRTAWYDNL